MLNDYLNLFPVLRTHWRTLYAFRARVWWLFIALLVPLSTWAQPTARPATADSLRLVAKERADSLRASRNAARRPTMRWTDRYASRFAQRTPTSPLLLRDPKAVSTEFRFDTSRATGGRGITVLERVGAGSRPSAGTGTAPSSATLPVAPTAPSSLLYRPAETIPFSQYNALLTDRARQNLWRQYGIQRDGQSAVSGRGLIPKLELPPIVDRIFGGSNMDFKPNGFVALDFGYLHQFIDNPQIPVRLRRQGNFIFNEQINVNFNGQIGERLGVLVNYDTKAAFNFENAVKLNYRPFGNNTPNLNSLQNPLNNLNTPSLNGVTPPSLNGPSANVPSLEPGLNAFGPAVARPKLGQFVPQNENIIQNIEAGNLSWALNSQLIPGVQNLFGLKVQTKFGKLNATFVASQQRSRQQTITLRGGTVARPFELRADQYEEDRHFFLSQFFRNNYERALRGLPVIQSGVTITRLEVYVTNRTNTTESLRNIVGFADLGESTRLNDPNNPNLQPILANTPANNGANGLYSKVKANPDLRFVDRTSDVLISTFGFQKGRDYDLLRGAKRLTDREYRFQRELGYISLITPLRTDEVLAVSYEYTYQGRRYQVGELTEDYQNQTDDKVLYLKLLKSSNIRNNLQLPMWDLMMKNIYALNNAQISKQGFQLRILYKDDQTGIDNPNLQEGRRLQGKPLVQVFNMDQLNQMLDRQPDGNFDFVDSVTVDSRYGRIIFPILEPFGAFLDKQFDPDEDNLRAKYVFNTLYRSTRADAVQIADKNKFFLKGAFQSGNGASVQLPPGVSEKSVQVTAGGVPLSPGQDYILEGQIGRLRIINESVTNSGRDIQITYEQPDLFQNQVRTLLGTRLDYLIAPDVNVGVTAMRLRETPAGYLTRVAIGNEPVNNTILGADVNLRKDSRALTTLLDKLPFVQTKELSTIQFQGEVASLLPSVAPRVNGNAFIDDFEATRLIFDLTRQPTRWKLGATPQQFPQGSFQNPLQYAYNRARISVYTVDQTIYQPGIGQGNTGTNLSDEEKNNFYERYFLPTDLFPGRSVRQIQLPENVLDIAYFPAERGMYNYNPDLNTDGSLKTPRQNFGAVTRAVASDNDFDNANIENITFWMMDPFIGGENGKVRGNPDNTKNRPNTTGGKLVLNLGDISEDVIKDGRYNFENGLPVGPTGPGSRERGVDSTAWGRVTRQQFVTNAFTNQTGARAKQDVGLDGLSDADERQYFSKYLDAIRPKLTPDAFRQIQNDPSNDDFQFYLGAQADSAKYIVARYKRFMGQENNSPESDSNSSQYTTEASTNLPDLEDLNIDNTVNDTEAYYEYNIDLRPGQQGVGKGYIIDKVETGGATWYKYQIPVREFASKVGSINGFKSIRFIRMYLTDFAEPVVLRFAQLQMESNQYRKYTGDLTQRSLQEVPEPYDANFKVGAVNIEENSQSNTGKYVYTLPPGFQRDRDFTQVNANVELNEQSMLLSVTNLRDGDSRAAFRNTNFDFLFRKRLRMFIHMHNDQNESGQVATFVRIGTDFTTNYYEIEIGNLKATRSGDSQDTDVWPAENELDIALEELINLKADRNRQFGRQFGLPYSTLSETGRYRLTIVGNPDLSSVQTIMIGVRNPRLLNDGERAKSFTVWVDELRANGFDQTAGYAAVAALNVKLADIGTITASGRLTTFGFGGVQTKVGERSRDLTTEYGVSSALALDRFFPEKWGLKIPMYVNYDTRRVTPHFNPLDPDTPLETTLSTLGNAEERTRYQRLTEDITTRRGLNFSNVRKIKVGTGGPNHFYDIENFGFTYAYNDTRRSNITTGEYTQEQYRGGIAYSYSPQQVVLEPFKRFAGLERPTLYWLKDFNISPLPTLIAIRTEVDRSLIRTQLRNADLTTNGIPAQVEKYFLFNRFYDLSWNLTRSLVVNYRSVANSIIDEPIGDINTDAKRDSVWKSIQHLGRMKNFQQSLNTTYRLPLDKLGFLDWMQADASYNVGYQFQANSYGITDSLGTPFGNIVRNNRDYGIQGRVDLIRLYNKIKSLRWANTPSIPRKNFTRSPGDDEEIQQQDSRVLKSFVRTLLTVRGINFNYNIVESTALPGFMPSPRFLGISPEGAPGLGFVLGSQNPGIKDRAVANGWLSKSTVQNQPFTQTLGKRFSASTTLEPFKDFRMVVNARYERSDSYQEFFRPGEVGGAFQSFSPVRNGQFSMSYLSFRTSFVPIRDDNTSPIFERFEQYRSTILTRLNQENKRVTEGKGEYNKNSQDVLIPAFFAAYSGQDPNQVKLSPFYSIPLPNWDITYSGLSNLPGIKKVFTSFTMQHRYSSTYSVGNYVSSLEYGRPDFGSTYVNLAVRGYPLSAAITPERQFIPVFVMSTITMSERFSPLLGVQFQTRSRISGRLEYNRQRDVALNLSNAQVAELNSKDITATIGFTKQNFRLPFRINGSVKKLKNDLTFQCALTFRDTRSIQRKLDAEQIITAGNVNFQLRPTINYVVSSRLNINFYFDRTFNNPLVSNSFIRATTSGGVQVRFNLAE